MQLTTIKSKKIHSYEVERILIQLLVKERTYEVLCVHSLSAAGCWLLVSTMLCPLMMLVAHWRQPVEPDAAVTKWSKVNCYFYPFYIFWPHVRAFVEDVYLIFLWLCFDSRLRCVDSSFSISAPTAWNNLPAHIRSCTSLSQFLSKLKSHLFITSFPPQ